MATPTDQTGEREMSDEGRTKPKHIILIVIAFVIGFHVVVGIIVLLLCCRRRKERRRRRGETGKAPAEDDPRKQPPAPAIPDTVDLPPIVSSSRESSATRKSSVVRKTPIEAPKVELPWAPDLMQKTMARPLKRPKADKRSSFDSS
jgi:hypothetical protein